MTENNKLDTVKLILDNFCIHKAKEITINFKFQQQKRFVFI